MQQIIVEKPYRFIPPMKTTVWSTLYRWLNLHAWYLARAEKVTSHELRGLEHFLASRKAGHAIILAPNHSRTADPLAVAWIAAETKSHFYGMASWHLFQHPMQRFFIRSMGGMSVNREGIDRAAVHMSIETLARAERPLVMFPEGVTSRTNDRLGPVMEGVTFIARAAAKRRRKESPDGKVVIHPVAIKYLYQGDAEEAIDETLEKIEHRLSWIPQRHLPLLDRILKVGETLLALKEMEHFGTFQQGSLSQRMDRLIDSLLAPHEVALFGQKGTDHAVLRVKALRIRLLAEIVEGKCDPQRELSCRKALADVYLAQQISAYPSDYLTIPTVDRMLEIVEKYEEDLTDVTRPHGPTKAVIEIGEAIEVSPERQRSGEGDPLMASLTERMQQMLSRLAQESPLYVPKRFPAKYEPDYPGDSSQVA